MSSIAYQIGDSLYLNITNRCTSKCTFCIRYKTKVFNSEHKLWLKKEPTSEEIIKAIGDPTKYKEVVFCGYGEPLIRLDIVIEVSKWLKVKGARVRIDTNGHGSLIHKRDIVPDLKGLVDSISISLNAQNRKVYNEVCQPDFGEDAFDAIIEFARECKKYIPEVELTVVGIPDIDIKAAKKIADGLGIPFRVRTYYEQDYVR
ncbi:MAG: TatD family nuclease-associated radical SAM protein [Candidatus Saganbacteria bacterium]|nr:TatD family nuclease-associated radical SAM protein [Candidatus Saganbacteria bacterium]